MGDDTNAANKDFVIEKLEPAIERHGTKGMRVVLFIPDGNFAIQKLAIKAFVDSLSKDIGENVPIKKDVGA